MVMKVNMSKAYDRLEWDFEEKVLVKLGFCNECVSLVMRCITSVKYNLFLGVRIEAEVTLSKGERLVSLPFYHCC